MNYWASFWGISLLFAGVAFIIITIIVTIKGFADLRFMVKSLQHDMADIASHAQPPKDSGKPLE